MRTLAQKASYALFLLCLVLPASSVAQTQSRPGSGKLSQATQAAIDLGMQFEDSVLDCSHFVNYLFSQVGLGFKYEPSRTLYRGTSEFRRVYRPVAGDLIVWRGHVGIVVDPEAKTFLSRLNSGVKLASYQSRYWRRRGIPHFLRYRLPERPAEPVWQARNASSMAQADGTE